MLKDHRADFRLKYIHLEVPPFRVTASRFRTGPLQACGASFLLYVTLLSNCDLGKKKKITHLQAQPSGDAWKFKRK